MLNTQIQNNDLKLVNVFLTDSRQQNYDQDTLWEQLNLSQQYAACSLGQFGYLLTYVRSIGDNTLAILKQNDKIATINEAGTININPAISCRQ
ncbi:hypothetical protein CXF71_15820 [Colwellia sp. 12G3]|nr:hypothetical protein CXF71_15820 [Colwellia sp. 12G3]